jgi:hypothetical protein
MPPLIFRDTDTLANTGILEPVGALSFKDHIAIQGLVVVLFLLP